MAPAYKLIYFDLPAAAEPARYLFAYGNIEFEDVRIKLDKWPEIKPTTPYGRVPLLEYNGKLINQGVPITKYIAKLVGLTGKDAWEDLEIESVAYTFVDFRANLRPLFLEKDEAKKAELRKVVEETAPYYLQRFEEQVKSNNGYFVGGKLTWADVYVTVQLGFWESFVKLDLFSKYPALKKLHETIISNENYKKWQKTVPSS